MGSTIAGILVNFVTSEFGKVLIGALLKKLVDSKTNGVTKEVTTSMLEAIGKSQSNAVPMDAIDVLKKKYL